MSEGNEARAALMEKLFSKAMEIRAIVDKFLKETGEEANLCDLTMNVGSNDVYFRCNCWASEQKNIAFEFCQVPDGQLKDETEIARKWRYEQRHGQTV